MVILRAVSLSRHNPKPRYNDKPAIQKLISTPGHPLVKTPKNIPWFVKMPVRRPTGAPVIYKTESSFMLNGLGEGGLVAVI